MVPEARHTPGPWLVNSQFIKAGEVCVAEAFAVQEGEPRLPQADNARLIAAAPDGYAILEFLHTWFRGDAPVYGLTLLDDDRTLRRAVAEYMARVHPERGGDLKISPSQGGCDLLPTEAPVPPCQSSSRGIEGGAGREAHEEADPKAETRKLVPPRGVARG